MLKPLSALLALPVVSAAYAWYAAVSEAELLPLWLLWA